MTVFDEQYARYYDLLYADKDYQAETDYVAGVIRSHNGVARSVLDLGCGTGRHAELLAEKGFDVHGIDQSEAMIDRARARCRNAAKLSFSVGDVTSFGSGESYDAIVSLFHVVSYQTSNEALENMFRQVSTSLSDNGVFLFDVWYGPAVLTTLPAVRVKRLEDDACRIMRIAEPRIDFSRNVVDVNYTILSTNRQTRVTTEFKETHQMRYLFQPEIEQLLNNFGMHLIGATEWMTQEAPSSATWSACYVATRRKNLGGATIRTVASA